MVMGVSTDAKGEQSRRRDLPEGYIEMPEVGFRVEY